jgi:hypothetical protein
LTVAQAAVARAQVALDPSVVDRMPPLRWMIGVLHGRTMREIAGSASREGR